jgi:quercetin dioxygenase-like cupin family protein
MGSAVELRVVEHRLSRGESAQLGPLPRVVYNVDDNSARFATAPVSIDGPVHTLSFELVPSPSGAALLSAALGPSNEDVLMRCDRVDFPPGGVAYLHTHQGPGIRVLLHGAIRIDTAGDSHSYGPFQAWFEPGTEPVFAAASETEPTAFVRCMILPVRLRGQSSIRYVREEDAAKPKSQRYTVFIDEPLVQAAEAQSCWRTVR